MSPNDLTAAIEKDIRKREKPKSSEEAFVQWAEYSPPFIAIGTACVALAIALLAIARKYPSSVSHPWAIPGVLARNDHDEESGKGVKPSMSRAEYGTADNRRPSMQGPDYAAKLTSPRTPEFRQSEIERLRLAKEENERIASEKMRAEIEQEHETKHAENNKRFEDELKQLKKEREAFETMKKDEELKKKERKERKERELRKLKEEKDMNAKLAQAKADAMAAAREEAKKMAEQMLAKPIVVEEDLEVEVEEVKQVATSTKDAKKSMSSKKGFFSSKK